MLALAYSIFDIKLLTVIATGFTIYFGYQKISKKVCVSFMISQSKLYDAHIGSLVVSNKRDNSLAISSIKLEIGNQGGFQLVKFEEPLVLKGYDTKLIDVPKYSRLYRGHVPVKIGFDDVLYFSIVTMSGKVIMCDVESPLSLDSIDGGIYKSVSTFNNIVLTDKMKFIFSYFLDGKVSDIIFDKHGYIWDSTPFRYNAFPDMTKESFRDFLIQYGYHKHFTNYALYEVNDRLQAELVLSKEMVNSFLDKAN
ncbi:hypothetical protein [Kosakonia oryzendophytica]|uniref:hypothetical protein n=1 Tax=Kosakonia oryzendophytica TaxID=1005665 RepID=UPI000902054B|nr:hypothetical protein [Kosakonia oryzendophytica]WBT56626.1 hypothetical protein O9K67_15770 [Kosakonia oryzendophytica]